MAASDSGDKRQNHDTSSRCHKSSPMSVRLLCGRCQQPVVGVSIREMPGWCSVECKACGYSAISHGG